MATGSWGYEVVMISLYGFDAASLVLLVLRLHIYRLVMHHHSQTKLEFL